MRTLGITVLLMTSGLSSAAAAEESPAAVNAPASDVKDTAKNETITARLSDPEEQKKIGRMVGTMAEAVLSMPITPIVDAANKVAGTPREEGAPGVALRDVMGDEAQKLPEVLSENVPKAMEKTATLVEVAKETVAAIAPAFADLAAQLKRNMGSLNETAKASK